MPAVQGRGYAREASQAVLQFAFEQCGVHKVCATVTAGNQASCNLLEKLGFEREGCLRQQFRLAGQWHDDLKYGLLADTWRAADLHRRMQGEAGAQLDAGA